MLKFYLYIVFASFSLPFIDAKFYSQGNTLPHEICDKSFQIHARSKIECTLKCKHRAKKTLFTPEQKCFCVPMSDKCEEGKKIKIKGSFIDVHEPNKCEIGFDGKNCENYVGEGLTWSNSATSCKQIKERYSKAESGFYWVQFPDLSVHVYCDMKTENGGWMLIGNITTASESQSTTRAYTEARSFDYNTLAELHKGKAVLDGSLFQTMYDRMGFTQFRIFCTKPYHKRVFHMVSRVTAHGLKFRDYVIGKSETWLSRPEDCRVALQKLPDDNSHLARACLEDSEYIRSSNYIGKDARLYDHVVYEHGNAHVQLYDKTRLECDDFQPKHSLNSGYNQIGQWLYFVR